MLFDKCVLYNIVSFDLSNTNSIIRSCKKFQRWMYENKEFMIIIGMYFVTQKEYRSRHKEIINSVNNEVKDLTTGCRCSDMCTCDWQDHPDPYENYTVLHNRVRRPKQSRRRWMMLGDPIDYWVVSSVIFNYRDLEGGYSHDQIRNMHDQDLEIHLPKNYRYSSSIDAKITNKNVSVM